MDPPYRLFTKAAGASLPDTVDVLTLLKRYGRAWTAWRLMQKT